MTGRYYACHYCAFASRDAEETFQHMFDRHRAVRRKSSAHASDPSLSDARVDGAAPLPGVGLRRS